MQTIVELPSYLRALDDLGIPAGERDAILDHIARQPSDGDVIPGAGGVRKLRIAGRGKGKSGGYRLVHFYSGTDIPLFLITIFSKSDRANLSRAECNNLAKLTAELRAAYARRSLR